jgi:hypothetical protein
MTPVHFLHRLKAFAALCWRGNVTVDKAYDSEKVRQQIEDEGALAN